jgi:predicted RNA-binding protein (virulence factor B family)
VNIGQWNRLRLDRFTSPGAYLEDEEGNDVLLPTKYVLPEFELDDMLDVFLYKDSEGRLIATTLEPKIFINEFAVLRIAEVNQYGAFAEWGVEKHLLIPYREQPKHLEEGKFYLIYMYLDEATQRLVGTTRTGLYIEQATAQEIERESRCELLVCERTELGVKVIVNNRFQGLIFMNDFTKPLRMGDRTSGYVKQIRPDGKLDISLLPEGYHKVNSLADEFLQLLKENDGYLDLSDKSSPETIQQVTGWSKKVFKQVIGNLYKQRLIRLHENGITLVESAD